MASEARQPPSLQAVQALLYDLITAPAGVLAGLGARGLPPDALDAVIVGDGRLDAAARLDIYANMYFFRILDVLREEFPRTAGTLGAERFHDLVTDYLLAARPAHPSLREAGARLPGFLRTHACAAARPWLAELAALERTHRQLFDGPDAAPLTLEALRALTPEAFSTLAVRLIPAHRLLVHAFQVSQAWETPEAEPPGGEETLLVWRRDARVHHRVVSGAEAVMLRRAVAPATLAELCEVFAGARAGAPDDEAALVAEAFQILARGVDDGALAAA